MRPKVTLRAMTDQDRASVMRIYQEGIDSGHATFQTDAGSWDNWDQGHMKECRLVASAEDRIIGWAALSDVSSRCVYRGVAELGIYVSQDARGLGVGKALLEALIKESEEADIWMLQASIFPENQASIKLHERQGFRIVGLREKLGRMAHGSSAGQWRDVALMERRSQSVGTS